MLRPTMSWSLSFPTFLRDYFSQLVVSLVFHQSVILYLTIYLTLFSGDTIISPQSYESIKDLELGLNFHPFYEGFLRISHKVTQVRAFPIKTLMMSKSAYSWERANLNPGWFLLPFTTCISSLQYWSFTSSWFRLAESSMHKNSSGTFHHLAASHGFYNNVEEYCHFHAKM